MACKIMKSSHMAPALPHSTKASQRLSRLVRRSAPSSFREVLFLEEKRRVGKFLAEVTAPATVARRVGVGLQPDTDYQPSQLNIIARPLSFVVKANFPCPQVSQLVRKVAPKHADQW